MKIRAITAFAELHIDRTETTLARAGAFLAGATHAFQQAGVVVQSRRVATQSFARLDPRHGPVGIPTLAARLRETAVAYGIDYLSLGPVGAGDDPDYVDALPDIFQAAEGVFASVEIANVEQGIDLALLRHVARSIQAISRVSPDGLSNLYFAAIANVEPGSPFFPAAYHSGGPTTFALAIEAADLAIQAFENAESPDEARQRLTDLINGAAQQMRPIAERLSAEYSFSFSGLDFSLAPYPGESSSLAGAMERLGTTAGSAGMVGAASLVMNAIEAATFPRCGFSGLMLPVLEDSVLGRRAAEGVLHINDLLLYSAICGTGLDCIPLPGDVSEAALAGILLDVAALSLRLDKPLTARLMPLPGKVTGDVVAFPAFEYFVPSRVMAAPAGLASGALGSDGIFNIMPRP
ncbi:MAG: DUF711 family protein [Chloroflexota bacterium]